ncbi:MAG: 7-carboxy-7-deazaguanine synthase QueE [Alphaproteobacteria bacterium]|nr:7-carboxy-7-deazaguanine synthase QueE [Alphaproteobacteria bacterium]
MKGTNPIRPPIHGDGLRLAVKSIFPTLQGEGPHAGVPAVFVRLGGCNLACDFCDTDFENFADMELAAITMEVKKQAGALFRLAVITGGEPLRQNIAPLCEALIAEGFTVQIETNGTLYRPLPDAVQIVCSPKNTGQGYPPIREDLLERITALKYIISDSHPHYRDVPEAPSPHIPVYVQPMDEYDAQKNAANLARATQLAMAHGLRLSLQLHKIAGIP